MAIVHELSWSTSRARTFDSCRRKYYYDYYLSWLGWGRNADPERRSAYLLKKMTRMPMFAGDIVHRAIERYYSRRDQGQPWTSEEAVDWAVKELRRGYKESRDGGWKARPAKSIRLSEHHYGEARIDEASGEAGRYGKRYVERIRECLNTFFEAPELRSVREVEPGDWLACEEMSTFELFDTKIFAIPDFAYVDREGESAPSQGGAVQGGAGQGGAGEVRGGGPAVKIVDWKTGAPREADRFQLEVYAFYARERWKVDPLKTTAVDAYLGDGSLAEVQITDEVLAGALARIESSLTEMKAVHFDADASKGDRESFPMVPEAEAPRACSSCSYRELCDRA